jgi:hypothetical protein
MLTRHRIRLPFMPVTAFSALTLLAALLAAQNPTDATNPAQASGWPSYAHDQHHSAVSAVAAQSLGKIHWSTPVDLNPPNGEIFRHYGSPLTTPANTTIVPVKVGQNSFRVEAHNGTDGSLLWTQMTDYKVPMTKSSLPGFYPVLDHKILVIPGGGGTVLVRYNPDQAVGRLVRVAFYGIQNYNAAPQTYQHNVLINTPITADSAGNIYFGFIVLGSTPIGLESGLARISPDGTGLWVAATSASHDANFAQVATSCGPALSSDEHTLYVTTTNTQAKNGDLLALDSKTLQTLGDVRLKDPASGLDALVTLSSSASPTVGPDGDVYFGVLENPLPSHNNRGWLLHFNSALTQQKTPGSFGWDDTASLVAASLVSSYHGTSQYLVMTKYNNYAGVGSGDGVNKLAVLDPNATEPDPIIPTTLVMNEVITIKGVTRDPNYPQFPDAVKEWCINTAAVDPVTKSILANSEDGKLYRWDLTNNSFSEKITLSDGIGEAYTPTIIGTDGTAYGISDAVLSAIGK